MAKRNRRGSGLGLVEKEHRATSVQFVRAVRASVDEAKTMLKDGRCRRAVDALEQAYEMRGQYIAHSQSDRTVGMSDKQANQRRGIMEDLYRTKERVTNACVLRAPKK